MAESKNRSILVKGNAIQITIRNEEDYISLTDMARTFDGGGSLIEQWLKNKDTVIFLGIWEQLHNPEFNSIEFEGIRNEAGRNSFYLSAKKWIEATGAVGLEAKAGRYGGTFAHRDIAFEFGSWLSPEFKLYLITEFQRLKDEEFQESATPWSFHRILSKVNYLIHTDAVKEHLIPARLTKEQSGEVYASEADLLNVALFGKTAAQWRETNPDADGNMRDAASLEQLVILSNLESLNAVLIRQGIPPQDRLSHLNEVAITQMGSLLNPAGAKKLEAFFGGKKK